MSKDPSQENPPSRPMIVRTLTRRKALRLGAGAVAAAAFAPGLLAARAGAARGTAAALEMIRRRIPSSGERIPVIGLGTWQTFMVGDSEAELAPLREVLRSFVDLGGTVIDSSPMYDPAERVTGALATELGLIDDLWIATKVWTEGEAQGRAQMERSMAELRRSSIELMQVHNLMDVEVHLDTLEEWKAEGRFRYIGITNTSRERYPAVEALLDDERIDFLQTNYSLAERESADRILPKAIERGVAVMVARPFAGGGLFPRVRDRTLPEWAADFDCTAWSQFFLKYIVSHPAVTCAIPATSNPDHLRENMRGGAGRLPDEATRRRMEELIDSY
jgi:aryl-alcohol dehydrogenase-like predicted oxidoreductase